MPTATLSSKSQIVIPVELRRQLGLRPGDRLILEAEEDRIIVKKEHRSFLDRLDALSGEVWQDGEEELRRSREEWDR